MAIAERETTTALSQLSKKTNGRNHIDLVAEIGRALDALNGLSDAVAKLEDPLLSDFPQVVRNVRAEILTRVPVLIWQRPGQEIIEKPQPSEKSLRVKESSAATPKEALVKPQVPEGYVGMSDFCSILGRSGQWWYMNKNNYDLDVVKVGNKNYYSKEGAEAIRSQINASPGKVDRQENIDDDTASRDAVNWYSHEIAKYPLLKATDEKRLGVKIFAGQLATRSLSVILESGLLSSDLEYRVRNFLNNSSVKNIKKVFDSKVSSSASRVLSGKARKQGYNREFTEESIETQQVNDAEFLETTQRQRISLEHKIHSIKELPSHDRAEALRAAIERYTYLTEEGIKAFDLMVNSNLRLVFSIAKRYIGRMPLEDLIAYVNFGLMEAAGKFNFRTGFKFSTYAIWWIRQSIERNIADYSRIIRIPVHMHERLNEYRHASRRLVQELGRDPTMEEVLAEIGDVEEKVRQAIKIDKTISLSAEIGEDSGEKASVLEDVIEDPSVNIEERVEKLALRDAIDEVLKTLSPREAKILKLRYGIEGARARTLEEVGRELDVTRERIRQIETKALRKLRHPSRSRKLRGLLD